MRKGPPRPNVAPVAIAVIALVALGWLGILMDGKRSNMAICLPLGVLLAFFGVAYYFAWTPPQEPPKD